MSMPNKRGETVENVERAHPWRAGRFAEAEPQERRGAPRSRNMGEPRRHEERPAGPRGGSRDRLSPSEWTGVDPLPPIDPSMPMFKPGDQGG